MKKLLTFSLPIFLVAYHLGMVHSAAFSSLNLDTNWDTFQCANENPIVDEKTIILTATGLNWPQDLFCLALRKNLKVSGGYEISTQLVNVAPRSGERNIGFAFNVKDENSYDYAYLRYLRSDCTVVEYGHVEKGTLGTKNSHLPCQKLSGNGWHIFRLSVNVNRDVDAYINGKKVGSFHAYFTSRGFGGVLVANGFNNVAEFRDFDISPQLADQDTNSPPAINPDKKLTIKAVELQNENEMRTKIKFFQPDELDHYTRCSTAIKHESNITLTFRIQRDDSYHNSYIKYRRLDSNKNEVFHFNTGNNTDHTNVVYDGRFLKCNGNGRGDNQCNNLPEGQPIPATIYEIDFNPRYGKAYSNQWFRNKYTISTTYYALVDECQGNIYRTPQQKGACAITENQNYAFHERCHCPNMPVSTCKSHCDNDDNCKGYVFLPSYGCQTATTSSCASGCNKHNKGSIGALVFDSDLLSDSYDGCYIKSIA